MLFGGSWGKSTVDCNIVVNAIMKGRGRWGWQAEGAGARWKLEVQMKCERIMLMKTLQCEKTSISAVK